MGFLLFAGRKLQLKARINQLNYRGMQLSQEQQKISAQIADKQKAINAAKNQVNQQAQGYMMGSILTGLGSNETVQEMLRSKGLASCSANDLQTLLRGGKIQADGRDYQLEASDLSSISGVYQQLQYQSQMQASYASNLINSVLDSSSQADLAVLNAKDSQISLELDNNESQLQLLTNEYQQVKKAEGNEAQNCTSSYGLA